MRIDLSLLPREFTQRLRKIIPREKQELVFSSFFRKRVTALRANTLKVSAEDLESVLRENGISLQRYRTLPNSFILIGSSTLKNLTDLPSYKEGLLYIQSLSSMLPPLILGPRAGQTVLDLAAAPGSKTTQMAAMMENKGSITALDVSQARLYKLLANLKSQGVKNTSVVKADARFFWREHREEFDKVLLDAPCSSEGRFEAYNPRTFSHWSEKLVRKMEYLQKSLIFSAVNCLRPGGRLVYSTCTFSPEENEAVIDFAFKKFKGRIEVEPISFKLPNFSKPLNSFLGVKFDPQVTNSVRVFPDEKFEGFFLCRIQKN